MQVTYFFLTLAAANIGVDHIALDGARPNQGHAGHYIFHLAGSQTGLQSALGRTFQLENTDGLTLTDHIISSTIIQIDLIIVPSSARFLDLLDSILHHR